MNSIKNSIIGLALRVRRKDIAAIYACALVDVALVAAVISLILFFV